MRFGESPLRVYAHSYPSYYVVDRGSTRVLWNPTSWNQKICIRILTATYCNTVFGEWTTDLDFECFFDYIFFAVRSRIFFRSPGIVISRFDRNVQSTFPILWGDTDDSKGVPASCNGFWSSELSRKNTIFSKSPSSDCYVYVQPNTLKPFKHFGVSGLHSKVLEFYAFFQSSHIVLVEP